MARTANRWENKFQLTYADEFSCGETYIDDGYSGTNTNRDGFQRLLADILAKRINCVVVKDLSRLARNYSDAGSLIDNLFVQMDVRFISLMENIDSYKNPDSVTSMLVPITNVFNENFCAQTSKRETELAKVMGYKQSAYEDWKDRIIDQDEYRHMKEGYDGQVARLRTVILTLKDELVRIENGIDTESPFLESFRKHQNIERLTREVMVELVDCVRVFDGGDISVKFKFKDELQLILEYIKDNKIAV